MISSTNHRAIISVILLALSGSLCAAPNPIDDEAICRHIEILASDEFKGRKSGTPAEQKTINYIAEQFAEIGLEPAANGSYFQPVELAKYTVVPPAKIKLDSPNGAQSWLHKRDFLMASTYSAETINIVSTELVFAGFGIHAPEIGWDDYKNIDVTGKIVVVLSDVPGEYTQDSTLWQGDPAANMYSKTFYKKEEAVRRGAVGLISIYKPPSHGMYTWESIANYVGVNDLKIKRSLFKEQLKFSAVITREAMTQLFAWAGQSGFDFQRAALQADFEPISLGVKAQFRFSNTWEDLTTHNVVGLLPGTDLADEVMVYSAHWDHVGVQASMTGDSIYNGAVDNASGTAALIELARAYKNGGATRRSILFVATGAEEMGLLGAVWYAKHPLFPLGKTAVNFNMDAHYPYGKSSHITAVVYGRSELDKYLEAAAAQQQRTLISNDAQNIAADIFFRSDHFPFVEAGIPAEFAVGFGEAVGHDNAIFQQRMAAYPQRYHQPTDEYEADFDCSGITQDAELIYLAGKMIDREGDFPMWYPGQAFDKFRRATRFESAYFKDVTATHTPLLTTQSRTMDARPADLDGDNDLDLVITGEFAYNIILINDGQGKFSDETLARLPLKRRDSEDITIADFDRDGDLDIIIVSEDDQRNEYYLNDGRGYFTDHSYRLPVTGTSNAVITMEVNGDTFPDVLIGNAGSNICLLNDGAGGWIVSDDRLPKNNKTTQDLEVGDIDGDGDLDIICGNEDDNEIWINDGQGYFTNETSTRLPLTAGAWETREADLGDVDGDGDLDLYLANVNFRQTKDHQNRLFINDGRGYFTDETPMRLPAEKMHSVDGDFVDYDGDGDLDIITGNGFGNSFEFYENNEKGYFKNQTQNVLPASVKGDGIDVEAADYNGDGRIDLYFCNFRGSDFLLLGK